MVFDGRISPIAQGPAGSISPIWRVVVAALLLTCSIFGQSNSPIGGTVTTRDSQPVEGVLVYGSMSEICCPFKRERTSTNSEGRFRMEQPGRVIHFSQDGLQPTTIVVGAQLSEIHIVMNPATNSVVIPICEKPASGQKRIGWGKYGLQFRVSTHQVAILGGNPDVDYVRYAIKPKGSNAYLELWFGGNAASSDAPDELFINSAELGERNILSPDGSITGKDSSGRLTSGGIWRHTAVFGGAAIYRDATREDASLFDQIIGSMCDVPSPNR